MKTIWQIWYNNYIKTLGKFEENYPISTFDNLSPQGVKITDEKYLANLVHNYIKTLGKFEENYPISTFDN